MNPMNVFKLKGLLERFKENHPKVPLFFQAATGTIQEGSIIEIKVKTTDNKTIVTNMKVNSEDLALIEEIKHLT